MNKYCPTIQCPQCQKSLIGVGSYATRLHTQAIFINKYRIPIILCLLPIFIPLTFIGYGLSSGFLSIAAILFPLGVTYAIERSFPLYRVISCPYCNYAEKSYMGVNMLASSENINIQLKRSSPSIKRLYNSPEVNAGSKDLKSIKMTIRNLRE